MSLSIAVNKGTISSQRQQYAKMFTPYQFSELVKCHFIRYINTRPGLTPGPMFIDVLLIVLRPYFITPRIPVISYFRSWSIQMN